MLLRFEARVGVTLNPPYFFSAICPFFFKNTQAQAAAMAEKDAAIAFLTKSLNDLNRNHESMKTEMEEELERMTHLKVGACAGTWVGAQSIADRITTSPE